MDRSITLSLLTRLPWPPRSPLRSPAAAGQYGQTASVAPPRRGSRFVPPAPAPPSASSGFRGTGPGTARVRLGNRHYVGARARGGLRAGTGAERRGWTWVPGHWR